jgi:hypothetical protein
MKHLKKFEELNTQTYYNAAKELHKMAKTNPDFRKRAHALENWGEISKWKKEVKELSSEKNQLFKVELVNNEWSKGNFKIEGDFYSNLFINVDMLSDTIADDISEGDEFGISFEVRFIPTSMSMIKELEDNITTMEYFTDMILIWGSIRFNIVDQSAKFDRIILDTDTDYGNITLTRAMVTFIRKQLLEYLTEGSTAKTYYTTDETMYDMLTTHLLGECGLSGDYGLTLEYIKDEITKLTANKILANYKR